MELGSRPLSVWPWWNYGWAETESTQNWPRNPERSLSLVSAPGCCSPLCYPLPFSAVPTSSCFPVRADNQLHGTIMVWCDLSALSSWDHSPCNTIADKSWISPRKSFSTTKWQSGLNSPLSERRSQLVGTNSWSSGGFHRGPQCHFFCSSHIPLPPMPALSTLACGNHVFLCVSLQSASLSAGDSICNPQWPLGHQNHRHHPIYINAK